jgi:EamA domain-containing membrane protein RarD
MTEILHAVLAAVMTLLPVVLLNVVIIMHAVKRGERLERSGGYETIPLEPVQTATVITTKERLLPRRSFIS